MLSKIPDTNTYMCYFAAYYTKEMSGCAFVIKNINNMVRISSKPGRFEALYQAEVHALLFLLKHIEQYIKPGSKLLIHSSNEMLINNFSAEQKRYTQSKARQLLRTMQQEYHISLIFVDSYANRLAHEMAEYEAIESKNKALVDENGKLNREAMPYDYMKSKFVRSIVRRSKKWVGKVELKRIAAEAFIIEKLIKEREKKGLSIDELAILSGVSNSDIESIETLAESPKIDNLIDILYTLGYTLKISPVDIDFVEYSQE